MNRIPRVGDLYTSNHSYAAYFMIIDIVENVDFIHGTETGFHIVYGHIDSRGNVLLSHAVWKKTWIIEDTNMGKLVLIGSVDD